MAPQVVASFGAARRIRREGKSASPDIVVVILASELLRQCDEDALRAADVAEPIFVFVLRQLANEFGAMRAQPGKGVLDVFDSEHDATYSQRVRRSVFRPSTDRLRMVELAQLKPGMAVRSPHHCD